MVQYVHVGVDVGGTNSDAVVLDGNEILGWSKQSTTEDITTGVVSSISSALNCALDASQKGVSSVRFRKSIHVTTVHIGTTHFVNAVLRRKNLVPVAVIRLCGPASESLPPFSYFPKDLAKIINGSCFMVNGGFHFDGKNEISPLNKDEIRNCLEKIKSSGIQNIVISGIFSPLNDAQEKQVGEWISEIYPSASFTLSSEIGQFGLLMRENSAILNESLKPLSKKTYTAFRCAFDQLKLRCPFYFTQNDGTLLSTEMAIKYPVFTFASGATNSMRGAAYLSGVKDALVVDIGGTTTDIGVLVSGFPRQSSTKMELGDVMTNFQMPDTLSVAIGGGSVVTFQASCKENDEKTKVCVGPDSVGHSLRRSAVIFGGQTLTATDIAVAEGLSDIGQWKESKLSQWLPGDLSKIGLQEIRFRIEDAIDRVKLQSENLPVILVGGGSILLDHTLPLKGASELIKPNHYQVANAVGAALSEISANVDTIANLDVTARDSAIAGAKKSACDKVIKRGGNPDTVKIVQVSDVSITYLPGNLTRLQVKAVADVIHDSGRNTASVWKGCQPITTPNIHLEVNNIKNENESEAAVNYDLYSDENYRHVDSYEPYIDCVSGEWHLRHFDVECIALGAGILGCGGGGDPTLAKICAHSLLDQGKLLRVLNPKRFHRTATENEYCLPHGFMGAPTVMSEMLNSKTKETKAVECLKQFWTKADSDSSIEDIEELDGVRYVNNFQPVGNSNSGKKISALCSCEVGGFNSMTPLLVGAEMHLPVLDCDLMGRAFPELQMVSTAINGENLCPAALGDYADSIICLHGENTNILESFFRKITVQYGCIASVAICPLKKDTILQHTILHSTSRAWKLGLAVLKARSQKLSPIKAILQFENGIHVVTGKISDVKRVTDGGFNKGEITIEGIDEFKTKQFQISFKNENLVIRNLLETENQVVASVPDLISIVDKETGEPIPTEELRYGLRVAVLVLPAPPMLTTPQALKVVSPAAFGFTDINYVPIGEYSQHISMLPE